MLVAGITFTICIIGCIKSCMRKQYLMQVILALNLLPIMFICWLFFLYKKYAELDSWLIFSFFPVFLIHFICVLQRVIDAVRFTRSWSELVAGYIVEVKFSRIMLNFLLLNMQILLAATLFNRTIIFRWRILHNIFNLI